MESNRVPRCRTVNLNFVIQLSLLRRAVDKHGPQQEGQSVSQKNRWDIFDRLTKITAF